MGQTYGSKVHFRKKKKKKKTWKGRDRKQNGLWKAKKTIQQKQQKKNKSVPSSQRMGGRWIKTLSSLLYNNHRHIPTTTPSSSLLSTPHFLFNRFLTVAAIPLDPDPIHLDPEDDPHVKIPIKAFFLSTRFKTSYVLFYCLVHFSNGLFLKFCFYVVVTCCQFWYCFIGVWCK